MIRLGIREYIKNFWLNIISIIMMIIMIVSMLILITNICKQLKFYNYIKPVLGDEGIVADYIDEDTMEELEKVDKIISSAQVFATTVDDKNAFSVSVYDRRMSKYIKPILSEGLWVDNITKHKDKLIAVISENNYGIKTGDTIELCMYTKEQEEVQVTVYICGIISEGQRIYSNRIQRERDCSYLDYFEVFSFEQGQQVQLITTENQLNKFSDDIYKEYANVFIKYEEGITQEEKDSNINYLNMYTEKITGIPNLADSFISTRELRTKTNREVKNVYFTYIPMIIADILLVGICLLGIVSVKTGKSMGHYGKLYLCGMSWKKGIFLSVTEVIINIFVSVVISSMAIMLQTKYKIYGMLNIEYGIVQIIAVVLVFIIMIICSTIMTWQIFRENTPVEIIKKSK